MKLDSVLTVAEQRDSGPSICGGKTYRRPALPEHERPGEGEEAEEQRGKGREEAG